VILRQIIPVSSPIEWTAECPYLYTVVLTLKSPAGDVIQCESCRVGFRNIDIVNGQVRVNYRPIMFRGDQ
jgi:beta-galactosidase